MRTRLPVRSALFKHDTGGLVVKWVTISESLLLYVFALLERKRWLDCLNVEGISTTVKDEVSLLIFVNI
jgi:hypothetical protein